MMQNIEKKKRTMLRERKNRASRYKGLESRGFVTPRLLSAIKSAGDHHESQLLRDRKWDITYKSIRSILSSFISPEKPCDDSLPEKDINKTIL